MRAEVCIHESAYQVQEHLLYNPLVLEIKTV